MNKQETKIIAASLLGDGMIIQEKVRNKNGRFRIRQRADHRDHLEYIAGQITFTGVKIRDDYPERKLIIAGKETIGKATVLLDTSAHPAFSTIRARMYQLGIKRVDPHYLTLIDAEFMAIWYQQDGFMGLGRTDTVNPDIVLCTDNFSYGDCMLLRTAIIEKTGYIFNVRRKGTNKYGEHTYRMYLYRKQAPSFIEYIRPFIQPSFEYKVNLARQDAHLLEHKK